MAPLQKRYQDQQKINPQRIKFLPPGPITLPISQLQYIPSYFFFLLMSVLLFYRSAVLLSSASSVMYLEDKREGGGNQGYPF